MRRIRLDPQAQRALAIAASVLAALLAVRFLYAPVLGRIRGQQEAMRDLRAKADAAAALAAKLPEQEAALQQAKSWVAALEAQWRQEQALARALDGLRAQAAALHLQFEATQAAQQGEGAAVELAPGQALQGVPLTVRLVGRYRHIGQFLDYLYTAPFLSQVRQVAVSRAVDHGVPVTAQVTLAVYVDRNRGIAP